MQSNNAVEEKRPVPPRSVIAKMLNEVDGGSAFEKLVSLRDTAQELINEERSVYEDKLTEEVERLAKQLAERREKLNSLDEIASAKARKTRSDAGTTRAPKTAT